MEQINVDVPPGCAGGDVVEFITGDGRTLNATVPDGSVEGDTFAVSVVPGFLDDVLDLLTQDRFADILDKYVERECHKFQTGDEFTMEQTEAHSVYVRMYESRIESHLRRHGKSSEEFLTALCAADACGELGGSSTSDSRRSLATSLLQVQNFESFATMCRQRALEKANGC
jgi:hypothetical protein